MHLIFRKIPFYPIFKLFQFAIQNGGIHPKKIPLFVAYLLKFIVFEPLRLLEVFIYTQPIKKHELEEDPIFILGYWRSGTSHLQHLLSKNPRHQSSTLFNLLFADNYYLTSFWLKKPLNFICKSLGLAFKIQRVPLQMDIAAELDTEMCTYCSDYAYSMGFLFPKKYNKFLDRLLYFEDKALEEEWMAEYNFLIKKLAFWHPGRRIVVKSPGDTARIKLLLQQYPNAKFVYIHRDSLEVFHSNRYLWNILQKSHSFQYIHQEKIDDYIIDTYKKVMQLYLEQRHILNKDNLIEIPFSSLITAPEETLEKVYEQLDLGPLPYKELRPFLQKNRTYKVNQYHTPKVVQEKIDQEWAFIHELIEDMEFVD